MRYNISFEPKEDITTFELALSLKFYAFVLGNRELETTSYFYVLNQQPETVRRHFVVSPITEN